MDEATVKSYRSVRHPFFAILIPFLFAWLVVTFLRSTIAAIGRLPALYPLLLFAAAVSETVVGNFLQAKKASGFLPRLRELIVILIISFFFIKLFNGELLQGNWKFVRVDIILGLVFIMAEWMLCFYVHSALRERELFLALVVNQSGNELKESFRRLGEEAANSLAGVAKVQKLLIAFQVLAFLGTVVIGLAFPEKLTTGVVLLVLAHFATGVVFLFTLRGYSEQQALMGDGFAMSKEIRSRRSTFAVIVCLVACLVLIPVIGRDAPLPSSYLQAFMEWLQRITTLPERTGDVKYDGTELQNIEYDLEEQEKAIKDLGEYREPNKRLQAILRTVILILIIGGPVGAIVFMIIQPLFRKREEKIHPLKALADWFQRTLTTIFKAFRSFFASLRYRKKHPGRRRRSILQTIFGRDSTAAREKAKEGRAGFFQRLALSREIKTFVRIIRWGEKQGVKFQRYHGPREYADFLADKVPDVQDSLVQVADILEEIMFSRHEITSDKTDEFHSSARLVLKYR